MILSGVHALGSVWPRGQMLLLLQTCASLHPGRAAAALPSGLTSVAQCFPKTNGLASRPAIQEALLPDETLNVG